MKSSVALSILNKPVSFLIYLAAVISIIFRTFRKIIFIDEIIPRVIRRIDVNHLHFSEIGFLEKFKGIQIIAFNVNVLGVSSARCSISPDGLFLFKAQCLCNRCICQNDRLSLVGPCELVTFLSIVNDLCIDFLHQNIFIDCADHFTVLVDCLCNSIREEGCQLFIIFLRQIRGVYLKLFHLLFPPIVLCSSAALYIIQTAS